MGEILPTRRGATKKLSRHFVFLPEASIEAIQTACAESNFTHVHILAHGIQYLEGKTGDTHWRA